MPPADPYACRNPEPQAKDLGQTRFPPFLESEEKAIAKIQGRDVEREISAYLRGCGQVVCRQSSGLF
jgi:hypothetical protein